MLDKLYTDIGAKIKNWAKWIFIVESIAAIITGIALMFEDAVFIGFIVLICGPLVAWVSSWILYAFGEFVEDTKAIRYNTEIIIQSTNHNPVEETARNNKSEAKECPNHQPEVCTKNKAVNVPTENSVEDTTWVCGKCNTRNLLSNNACWRCGNPK